MTDMNKKALALLGLGHMMVDLNTGALPALLPFLKSTFNLSYTMIGTLVLVASLSSSLINPSSVIYRTAVLVRGCYRSGCSQRLLEWLPSVSPRVISSSFSSSV